MTKIEALKKTVYNLENDVYEYDWFDFNSCNCGVLAKAVLNGQSAESCGYRDSPISGGHAGCFSKRAYCMTTDLPLPLVFQTLKDVGFTHQDLLELEFLGNVHIANKIGKIVDVNYWPGVNIIHGFFDKKETLISYLKAWVELLTEEQEPTYTDITKDLAILPVDKIETDLPVKELNHV